MNRLVEFCPALRGAPIVGCAALRDGSHQATGRAQPTAGAPVNPGSEELAMRTGEEHSERDDAAPVDMLASLFEARGWPCEFVSDDEIHGEIQGSWASYQLRCIWRAEDHVLQILCLPDIRVPDEKKAAVFEVMALINEQVWLGHFDIWSNGSVLLYRHGLMLGDDGLLSLVQAQTAIEAAVDECDRFYPAFQFLLWGDKSPAEALASALIDAAGEA